MFHVSLRHQVQTALENPTRYHVIQKQKNQVRQYLSESFQSQDSNWENLSAPSGKAMSMKYVSREESSLTEDCDPTFLASSHRPRRVTSHPVPSRSVLRPCRSTQSPARVKWADRGGRRRHRNRLPVDPPQLLQRPAACHRICRIIVTTPSSPPARMPCHRV